MNLGVVTPQLSAYGGSEIYLLECLKRWQKDSDITVYTPSIDKKLLKEFGIGPEVKVIRLPSSRTHDQRFRLLQEIVVLPHIWEQQIQRHDLYFLYLFPTHLIQRRPSVWFASEPLRMLYDLCRYSNESDADHAVHFYPKSHYDHVRLSDLDVIQQIIEKVDVAAQFDRLVTNSYTMGQYLENIYRREPDRIAYPGVNLPKDISPPPTFDKVLYVGHLWKHKRVELAIKAMALTMSPNKLIIAGDGPEKLRLQRLTKELGMTKSVLFVGDVSMEKREQLYKECTCCVYPPVREPFGMVPLEAAAAGRPVVATVGGGYSEILNKEAAFIVPAYEGAIADAIHALMSNPDLAMKMGRAGRRIIEPYTWDRTADILMEVFKETIEEHIGQKYGKNLKRKNVPLTRLGAHYYPWYQAGKNPLHWNENTTHAGVTDLPLGGPYSSHHKSVIERHLKMAERAGIDFFIVNMQVDFRGLKPSEVQAAHRLFEIVEKKEHPTKLAILLAVATEDLEVVKAAILHVKKDFLSRPCYLRHKRRPVLWHYLNDPLQGLLFYHYGQLRKWLRGTYSVATGSVSYHKYIPRLLRRFFSGWCFYSPLKVGEKNIWEVVWRESYREFVEDSGELWVFTISPGFDDSHLTSEERKKKNQRRIPRMGLKTYELMQRAALDLVPTPDYVVITSFNEFHENTHIESSKKFGNLYLKSTHNFKERLRENRR